MESILSKGTVTPHIKTDERIYWIEFARVIGALAVVALHISGVIIVTQSFFGSKTWWAATFINLSTRWCVPVFVMMSGALLLNPKSETSLKTFFHKRFTRVVIPLFFWSAIYFWYGSAVLKTPFSWKNILTNLAMGTPFYHLYFLYVMIGLYAVTPIINIYLKSATKKNILYAMVLCFGLSILNNSLFHFAPGVAISVNGFTHFLLYICYYLAGHYLKDAKLNRKQLSLSLVSIIFLVTIGTIGTYFMMKFLPAHSAMFQEYFSPNNVALSLLVFISFSNINFSRTNFIKPATKIIDPCTLGIYLIHPLFLNYLLEYPVLGLYSPVPWLGLFKFIILIFTVSFSVVYVFRLLFEKVPIIKYIFG